MANPGYPMQPQPPPMGGMPPMGPPMGAMGPGPAMRPMRQGTSKAVPVVVSAGLAVGVFCGLLFGLGTGDDEASAATGTETKQEGSGANTPDVLMAKPSTAVPGTGSAEPPANGSAATVANGSAAPAAGSGAEAGSAAPAIKMVKLIIELKPEAAAQAAKITINDKDVEATSELEIGDAPKKKVKIVIKAAGYRDYTYEGEVEAGKDTKFEFELQKKPRPTGNLPRPENPGGGKKPGNGGKKPGGGLIDI